MEWINVAIKIISVLAAFLAAVGILLVIAMCIMLILGFKNYITPFNKMSLMSIIDLPYDIDLMTMKTFKKKKVYVVGGETKTKSGRIKNVYYLSIISEYYNMDYDGFIKSLEHYGAKEKIIFNWQSKNKLEQYMAFKKEDDANKFIDYIVSILIVEKLTT